MLLKELSKENKDNKDRDPGNRTGVKYRQPQEIRPKPSWEAQRIIKGPQQCIPPYCPYPPSVFFLTEITKYYYNQAPCPQKHVSPTLLSESSSNLLSSETVPSTDCALFCIWGVGAETKLASASSLTFSLRHR